MSCSVVFPFSCFDHRRVAFTLSLKIFRSNTSSFGEGDFGRIPSGLEFVNLMLRLARWYLDPFEFWYLACSAFLSK
jgi:hypothetical protein